jgi:GntR family transcriptional regulator/MocR family aminotransferase
VIVQLAGKGPLYQRIYRGLRRAILDGRLPAGARVPSTRGLAVDLGVSRNVVLMAFEQLAAEGYVEARRGSGTFISTTLPDGGFALPTVGVGTSAAAPAPTLSTRARRVLALAPLPAPGAPLQAGLRYDFRYGVPSVADFPHQIWSRLVARRARTVSIRTLQYGRALGYEPLRKEIAGYLARARGVAATPERVVIVNGSQQALDLVSRLFIDPGAGVLVEEPCYHGARNIFAAAGARLVPIPVDEFGLDLSRVRRTRSMRLAYVTPSHQFPLGGLLPLARRLELLRWAEDTNAYIVEDDYDSEFRYEGRPVEAVQGLDRAGRVLYIGTFSKVLFPSLRIGYLVLPESLVPAAAATKFLMDFHTPTFEQEVLASFITEGHFERHLRRSRARNAARRVTLLASLDEALGTRAEIVGENAGIHVVVWLRDIEASQVRGLASRAAALGLGIYSVTPCYVHPPRRAGLLLGYACLNERQIREGVRLLGRLLREF